MDPDIKNAALHKLRIKEAITAFLYSSAQEKLHLRLEALTVRNTVLLGSDHKSFAYKGELYNLDITPAPKRWNRLVPDLTKEMDTYLRYMKAIELEKPDILNYLSQVLNCTNLYGDYLRLFPECIRASIREFCEYCPARDDDFLDTLAQELNERNQQSINRIKERLVTNLIL